MRRIYILVILFLTAISGFSQSFHQQCVEFQSNSALKNAVLGVHAKKLNGEELINIYANKRLVPASNMKLITTGAALHALGSDYKFPTEIGYFGEIIDSVLVGDLYIIGKGDPTIGMKDELSIPLENIFSEWKKIIQEAGIKEIEGRVIGDGRYYEGMLEHGSWSWEDIGTYYGTGCSALCFYGNVLDFRMESGEKIGDNLSIKQTYPLTPWMTFINNGSTGREKTGDRVYMFGSHLATIAEFRGTFAVDRRPKTLSCSNKFSEYTLAKYFSDYLANNGINCKDGAADCGYVFGAPKIAHPDSIVVIGKTFSNSLFRIALRTNYISDNLYAEALLKKIGKEYEGSADYEASLKALREVVAKIVGKNLTGAHIKDGSGLSRQNYLSPEFITSFLIGMSKSDSFESFIESLPNPSEEGTMETFMAKEPKEIIYRIFLKSGSLSNVRSFSGYILPQGCSDINEMTASQRKEIIAFSIICNNFTASQSQVQKAIEKLVLSLATN